MYVIEGERGVCLSSKTSSLVILLIRMIRVEDNETFLSLLYRFGFSLYVTIIYREGKV